MRYSRALMAGFVVVMIAAMTFTMVNANSPSLPLMIDEDNDTPDISKFTPLPDDYMPSSGIILDDVAPQPISPRSTNLIYTKTPKFYFTRDSNATKYRITVTDITAEPDVVVYKYKGEGACGTAYCWLQPDIKLQLLKYQATSGGYYSWTVEAKVAGEWQPVSSPAYFIVFSKGFTSTFDGDSRNWQVLTGTWSLTSKGYYKTNGIVTEGSNIVRKEAFWTGFVYEARMKRKGNNGPNYIVISGDPGSISTWPYYWGEGYTFEYYDTGLDVGYWSLYFHSLGIKTTIVDYEPSPYIESWDWNTLTVWEMNGNIFLWINGVYLGYFEADVLPATFVGIGMHYTSILDPAILLVDYAKGYYSAIGPYDIKLTPSGELDPAYDLTAN